MRVVEMMRMVLHTERDEYEGNENDSLFNILIRVSSRLD